MKEAVKEAVVTRPTEALTGIGGAGVVYGFMTQAGVSPIVSAIVAVVIAFVPAGVSEVVDEIRTSK